ncbi:MAG: sensor histidine kinase KdpD [Oscillospiraceae bacterium]|nr:sensor histidine kinase KdpD [Oscillospiraceae bacterium]MBP3684566.1 sensor histidine kinase KdpD [Oscillospiraceae bacterium]
MAEHILVGLSSAPSNARIIRTAATMAEAFGGTFTALFVRTPNYEAMSEENKERLRQNTALAQELGATIETVFGDDVSYQIAEYARLSGVTKIVVGRSAVSKRKLFGKPTLTEKLTQIAPNIDIHIIPDASTDPAYRQKKARKKVDLRTTLRDWGISAGILALASGLAFLFSKVGFSEANIIAIYLLAVLLTAMVTSTRSSYVLSAIGSVLVFNFFFTYPQFSLRVYADGAPLTFLIMLIASLTVGTMTDRMKGQTKQSTQAAYRTNLLLETNLLLQKAQSDGEVLQACRTQVSKLLGRTAAVLPGVVASANKDTQRYPIKVQDRIYGTVVIEGAEPLEAFENSVLLSILGECALTLENSRNTKEKEAAKLQAENEKLRANLLRSISHDLRTPLTSISGNAGMLLSDLEKLDTETVRQMCGDIYDDSAWLTNLVENLLAVTKIEEGRMRLQKQPHLVEEIVSEALQHISRKQTEHIVTVHHENELLLAKCDARLIIQVIINLVDNAIKYTPAGSHITITTKQNEQHTEISVADNGAGIPDSEKEKVFQMFYSGSNPIADCRRSLGLGLSLCKSIITAHGGEITVSDNTPTGTIFTFTIPSGEVEVHE